MISKLRMCWQIITSKEFKVFKRHLTYLDGTHTIAVETIIVITESKINNIMKIEKQMDSAVDEVNNILKGKV